LSSISKDIGRITTFNILLEFLTTGKQLKLIINNHIDKLNVNDKRFVFKTCNGSIEHYILINSIIKKYSKINNSDKTIALLLFSIYHQLFSKNIPNYAIINSAVELSKYKKLNNHNFINAILRKISKIEDIDFFDNNVIHSYPKWLYDIFLKQFGYNDLSQIINWNKTNRDIYLRQIKPGNFSKTSLFLNKNNVKFSVYNNYTDYIKIENIDSNIISTLTKNNFGYIQSPSSGFVVKLLSPKSNDIIVDACSAPGGKSVHISNIINNNGIIYAYESNKSRFNLLKSNIKQYNTININPINSDFRKCELRNIDKILLDVPCSGTGVINRKPDIKIRLKKNHIIRFKKLQMSLLNYASKIISYGGTIVYSTCSILEMENWQLINEFLKNNEEFKVINANNYIDSKFVDNNGALMILPHLHHLDGMFAVRLSKCKK